MKIKNFVTGLLAALCLTAVLCPAALAAPVEDDGELGQDHRELPR